jgi:hypothetical protein
MSRLPTRSERLQVIFAFLLIFPGLMFITSPDPNRAQVLFRATTALVGLIGLAWLSTRRRGG